MNQFVNHSRIAVGVSGGRDSLALLYYMRPWWDKCTFYWVDSGDSLPETVELMERIEGMVPSFKRVASDVIAGIGMYGYPSSVLVSSDTADGQFVLGVHGIKVQPDISCCARTLMVPLLNAMLQDGNTCVVRGRRKDEEDQSPEAQMFNGVEYVFPLWDWTVADVNAYLESVGEELPALYRYIDHSIDCLHCTGWEHHKHMKYLTARFPSAADFVARVRSEVYARVADTMKCNLEVHHG